jgi:hypothetical protein
MLSDLDSPDDGDGEDDDELIPQKKNAKSPVKKAKPSAKSGQPKAQKQSEKGKTDEKDEAAPPPTKKASKCVG